jgi:hypothetical protein
MRYHSIERKYLLDQAGLLDHLLPEFSIAENLGISFHWGLPSWLGK